MGKELVISSNRHETKLAILEDDQLVEVYFQRSNEYSLAGSIHKGRVTRVLPGMQSAFVDLGLERDTFLYVSDFFEESEEYDRIPPGKEEGGGEREERGSRVGAEDRPRGEREERGARPGGEDRPRGEREERGPRQDRGYRGDRGPRGEGGRHRSPIASAPVDAAPLEAGPIMPDLDDVDEGPEISTETTLDSAATTLSPGTEAPQRSSERSGEDDRRGGRRSRRRRNRGHGFPDSKYADASSSTDSSAATTMSEAASSGFEEANATDPFDASFLLLPGESVAKYRQLVKEAPGGPASKRTEDGEPEPLAYATPESISGAAVAFAPVENRSGEIRERETPPFQEEETAEANEAAGWQRPQRDLGAVPSAELLTNELNEAVEASAHEALPEEHATYSRQPDIDAEEGGLDEISEARDEARAARLLGLDEPGDGPEVESDGEEEPDLENVEPSAPSSPAMGLQEAPGEGTQGPLNASLRDQGSRYMHRMPRRMRRKMRGPGSQEGRGTPEAAPPLADVVQMPPRAETRSAGRAEPRTEKSAGAPSITDLLKEGQEILVQIAKEPLGQKGARITSHIALPGRYVVYMPTVDHHGVSRKVGSDEERLRLKRILQTHCVGIPGGFIVRTAGEGHSEEEIAADMNFLFNLWLDIRQKAEKRPAPALLHHDLDIVQRTLRDQFTTDFKTIWVDNEEVYESVLRFVQRFQPALVGRIKLYVRSAPIFDAFNITPELEKALRPKVWLKSGGYIVINQTEALVAIDVNTGKFVGKSNRLEDTIVKTNTEAVKEIVRQIRLRDLGGIIVVDFIDMDERKNRQKVMQTLEEAMRSDKAPYKILQFNDFGLVAITRKRVKQSLERTLCAPCPHCEGAGYIKSVQTTIGEILNEGHKIAPALEGKDVMLRVHPDVAKVFKSNGNQFLEELEDILRRPVMIKSDPALHHEKFDLA